MSLGNDLKKKAEEELDLSYTDELIFWLAWRRVVVKMGPWLQRFWTDPAFFVGMVRAFVGIFANAVLAGEISFENPTVEGWAWKLAHLWPIILARPAGQTNQSEGDIKAISIDPSVSPTIGR